MERLGLEIFQSKGTNKRFWLLELVDCYGTYKIIRYFGGKNSRKFTTKVDSVTEDLETAVEFFYNVTKKKLKDKSFTMLENGDSLDSVGQELLRIILKYNQPQSPKQVKATQPQPKEHRKLSI
jgi:hypothetical protein